MTDGLDSPLKISSTKSIKKRVWTASLERPFERLFSPPKSRKPKSMTSKIHFGHVTNKHAGGQTPVKASSTAPRALWPFAPAGFPTQCCCSDPGGHADDTGIFLKQVPMQWIWVRPRTGISNKLPSAADAVGLLTTLRAAEVYQGFSAPDSLFQVIHPIRTQPLSSWCAPS